MKCQIKIHLDKNVESHFNLHIYAKKAVVVIILQRLEDRHEILQRMKMLTIRDMEAQLCLKFWPKVLRYDIAFQHNLLGLFDSRSVEQMTNQIVANMQKHGKHPDFYDSTNMEKIKNYITNIVGPVDDSVVKAVREHITTNLV